MGELRDPRSEPGRLPAGGGLGGPPEALLAQTWEDLYALLGALVQSLSTSDAQQGGPEDLARQAQSRLAGIRELVQERNRHLVALHAQQDEFLSVVAHDLRTPLVAIQGFAQLLLTGGSLGDKERLYVERILQGVRAMGRLVEDLRTARRLDRGALSLELMTVAPEEFAVDLVEMHREEARQKEVEIHVDAEPALPRMQCDPERLGQALGNLLQNAVKFSPRGSRVVLRLHHTSEALRFEIMDEGPGIDEEILPELFQRFAQRLPPGRAGSKGFGIGLHICREIVLLHGGQVGARNQPEGGSCFWVEVPWRTGGEGERP